MYAIVDIAGQQFKVEKDQKIFVHRLKDEEGTKVQFDNVLLIDNGKSVVIGEPGIKGAAVSVKVISHVKGDKVLVFKKKRRKGYQKKNGHRQYFSEIIIEEIIEKGAVTKKVEPKVTSKKSVAKATEDKPIAKDTTKTSTEVKKSTTATAKKEPIATKDAPKVAAKKTATTTKPAAKKPVAKAKSTAAKITTVKPTAKKPTAKKPAAKTKPVAKTTAKKAASKDKK